MFVMLMIPVDYHTHKFTYKVQRKIFTRRKLQHFATFTAALENLSNSPLYVQHFYGMISIDHCYRKICSNFALPTAIKLKVPH